MSEEQFTARDEIEASKPSLGWQIVDVVLFLLISAMVLVMSLVVVNVSYQMMTFGEIRGALALSYIATYLIIGYLGYLPLFLIFYLAGKDEGRVPAKPFIRSGTKLMMVVFPLLVVMLGVLVRVVRALN